MINKISKLRLKESGSNITSCNENGTSFVLNVAGHYRGFDNMRKNSGFTAIELSVTLAIMVVVAAFIMPPYLKWQRSYRLRGAVNNLMADVEMAKIRAIRENSFVSVLFQTDKYVVFVDNGEGAGGSRGPGAARRGRGALAYGRPPCLAARRAARRDALRRRFSAKRCLRRRFSPGLR